MTAEIALTLGLLVVAVVMFTLEWIDVDVTAIALLVLVVLLGLIPAEHAFRGFGSSTVVTMLGLLVLTAALGRTGVVDMVGRAILRRTGASPFRVMLAITLGAAVLGAFISNTASTAFFLPIAMGLATQAKISPSKLLMPIAFAGILTSSVTLVSTSTNLVVSDLASQYGMAPIGMFEMAPVGVPIAVVGLVYLLAVGRRLIPDRKPAASLTEEFGLSNYLAELVILPDSPLVAAALGDTPIGKSLDLRVLSIVRGKERVFGVRRSTRLQAGDVLLVEGRRDEVLKVKDTPGVELHRDVDLHDEDFEQADLQLAEVLVLPGSTLVGRSIGAFRFRERFGLLVLAINRHRKRLLDQMADVRLRAGDLLLVQGTSEQLAVLSDATGFRVLDTRIAARPNLGRARVAMGIFAAALVLPSFELVSLPLAVLAGVVVAFVTRCITPQEAYHEVDWRVLILVACMLGFGQVMETTGTAAYLAGHVVRVFGAHDPIWLLAGFFVLAVLLTQPMSNQAAAVLVVPVAIQAARQLELNPRTFVMMVAVAASTSYMTPLEPACLMVSSPGGYRFRDFVTVGGLLTLVILAVSLFLVPMVWPLAG